MFGYTSGEITLPLILIGLTLWVLVLWRVRHEISDHTPVGNSVRAAMIVTFLGVLIGLALTSLSTKLWGPLSDGAQLASVVTRVVVIVGALYAHTSIIVVNRRKSD